MKCRESTFGSACYIEVSRRISRECVYVIRFGPAEVSRVFQGLAVGTEDRKESVGVAAVKGRLISIFQRESTSCEASNICSTAAIDGD